MKDIHFPNFIDQNNGYFQHLDVLDILQLLHVFMHFLFLETQLAIFLLEIILLQEPKFPSKQFHNFF